MQVDLAHYDNSGYNPGRGLIWRISWYVVSAVFFRSMLLPISGFKRLILRLFGATIGRGVVIKPNVTIKYPWNLTIGNHSWVGEGVWLDNLAPITIGNHVCISQNAYCCTGNHDWTDPVFRLIVQPIAIADGVWIGARAFVAPGTTLASHSIVTAGSMMSSDSEPGGIYMGNPAVKTKNRVIKPGYANLTRYQGRRRPERPDRDPATADHRHHQTECRRDD